MQHILSMPTFIGDSDGGRFSESLPAVTGGPGLTEEEEAEVRTGTIVWQMLD